jgi:hypothetical protein
MLNLDVITHVITWFITLVAAHEVAKDTLLEEIAASESSLQEYIAKTDSHLHRCFVESMRLRPFGSKPSCLDITVLNTSLITSKFSQSAKLLLLSKTSMASW